MAGMGKIGRASRARPVLLERCEEIKPVEADAFHGRFPVESERGIRPSTRPPNCQLGSTTKEGTDRCSGTAQTNPSGFVLRNRLYEYMSCSIARLTNRYHEGKE